MTLHPTTVPGNWVGHVRLTAARFAKRPHPVAPRRVRSRRAVVLFLFAFAAATVGFTVASDSFAPMLRDPEFGKKVSRMKARMAANPGRSVVAVFGSSRVGMGVRPPAVEAGFDPARRPVVANLSLLGSGPVMHLLAYERLRRTGIRPAAVVVEYWPVFARAGDDDREEFRIDPVRLYPTDRPVVRDAFRDPDALDRALLKARLNPWITLRARLIGLVLPKLLPPAVRADAGWAGLDAHGWMPGPPEIPAGVEYPRRLETLHNYFAPRLRNTTVSDLSDRAFRTIVARCRADGTPVTFVWMPESSEFRRAYSPESEAATTAYWHTLTRESGVPGIDLRARMPDRFLTDGFHLTTSGAAAFGPVFAAELQKAFPVLRGDE